MDVSAGSRRERQKEDTRAAIIDAFLELSHDANTVAISVPAVADRASVSVRTVYRYFATKDELQTAAANLFNDRVTRQLRSTITPANFAEYLLELWSEFERETPAVLAEHATPTGRRLRATRLSGSRRTVRDAIGDTADDETVDLIIAVTSSSMYLELVDRMGHSPERAVAMVERAVRLLLADTAEPQEPGERL